MSVDVEDSVRITSDEVRETYRVEDGEVIDDECRHGFDLVVEAEDEYGDIRHLSVNRDEVELLD